MKVKYIGESFYNGFGLTNNKIYTCTNIAEEEECLEIIDDDQEEFLYPIKNPKPLDGSSKGGKWEIIEDPNGLLTKKFKELNLL